MSLTVVVMARSKIVTMRFSISSGDRPPYVQTTLTTGMSIYGKMSTGMLMIALAPRMAISTAITTKVYGRRRANRTIHICYPLGRALFNNKGRAADFDHPPGVVLDSPLGP